MMTAVEGTSHGKDQFRPQAHAMANGAAIQTKSVNAPKKSMATSPQKNHLPLPISIGAAISANSHRMAVF